MKLTNRFNLPAPLVRAIENDPYTKGDADFSVTELLQPARARALIKQHWDEIEEDASDKIWALLGQIGHTILERAGDSGLVEKRFSAQYATFKISGRADLAFTEVGDDGEMAELFDYKFCSVWTVNEGVKPEWEEQCNILIWLAFNQAQYPIHISKASIVAIFRDWSKPKARREKDYPQSQVQVLPVNIWGMAQTEKFIGERIAAHISAKTHLPLCTDHERWRTPEKFALMKKGNKRAVKLYDTEAQAEAALPTGFTAKNYFVEHRPGESKRCDSYCLAAPFCSQYQTERMENENRTKTTRT